MVTPIWLMKIWGGLKTVGAWFKGHWYLFLIVGTLVYAAIFAKNKASLFNQFLKEFKEQRAQNSRQLDELRRIQQEQIIKQQEISQKYNEVLDKIQRDYRDQLRTLDAKKEADLRQIIAATKDDPAAMARDINILFGIPVMDTTP